MTAIANPALRLTDVSRRFGGLLAVRDVTINVAHGERRVLLGPNGAGKTTLFNLVAGDLPVSGGRIHLGGRDITRLRPHQRARLGIARSYQRSTLFAGLSVADNIRLARLGATGHRWGIRRGPAKALDDVVAQTARLVGLGDAIDTDTLLLSHGQQRQLELGIALAGEPSLLLLDEPAAGLSPAERSLLATLLRELPRELTVVLIEHDMDVALPFADRVTVMSDGVVMAEGTPEEITSSQAVHDIYLGGSRE